MKVTQSYLTLCRLYPWTIWSMEFSRPKYWSGWLFISPRDLPNPGIEPRSPTLQADPFLDEPPEKPKNTGVGGLSLLLGNLPYSGIKLGGPTLPADSSPAELQNMLHLLQSHTRGHMGSKGPDSTVDFRKDFLFFSFFLRQSE